MKTEKQKTIKQSVSLSGTGLHTGQKGTLTFHPAEINHGIKFRRIDVEGKPIVEARVENVVDTSRGTTIAHNGVRVYTVEHILASLRGAGVDNVLIDINCEEPPIQDGSARYMIEALKSAGIVEQDAEREYLRVKKTVTCFHPKIGCEISIKPANDFRMEVSVDYNSQVLKPQTATLRSMDDFEKEIAPCRTFVFFQELEMLLNHNLIKGGDLSTAIVFVEDVVPAGELKRIAKLFNMESVGIHQGGILNNTSLHFENEPARHKLLDLIGDMALLGKPILGHVKAFKPGHLANTEFVKMVIENLE
ncbi:MAG: UDP-3-O-acyl-N-acetylglucosamine deacetylase [Bacteroidales bacterium]|nr:UDP-3-O-acyl-N-acetylglucosamine deacetylase [Bacteroidales bacterium]